jgi:hypothetical protein
VTFVRERPDTVDRNALVVLDGADGSVVWRSASTFPDRGPAEMFAADLDGDRRAEVVAGDGNDLDVLNGVDGTVRWTVRRSRVQVE